VRDPRHRRPPRLPALAAAAALLGPAGCALVPGYGPGDPAAPPPPEAPAWRPGEALALLLAPPAGGAHPIDDDYLATTADWRARVREIDDRLAGLRTYVKRDRGGTRTWYFDGPETVLFRVDVGADGTIDQSQYFGPEGLFAIVHRFAGGRRTQRIWWPPGQPRVVEVRDNLPPFPGVWWRSDLNPFEPAPPGEAPPDGDPGRS
jgi:hypothetical protein